MEILIIEDDDISSMKIQQIVESNNWNIMGIVKNIPEVESFLQIQIPDLIISDIMLGYDNIFKIFENEDYLKIPFLFITSSEDEQNFINSKKLLYSGFVMKPIHEFTIISTANLILKEYKRHLPRQTKGILVNGKYNEKILVKYSDILLLEVQGNYSVLKTKTQIFAVKKSLQKIYDELGDDFLQVNRNNIININYLKNFDLRNMIIYIETNEIPIGKKYKNELLKIIANKKLITI